MHKYHIHIKLRVFYDKALHNFISIWYSVKFQPQRSHPLAAIPPLFPQQSRPLSPFSPPSSPSMVSGRHHQFAPAQPSPLTVVRPNQDKPAPNQTPLSSHIAIAPSPVPGASGHKVVPKKISNVPIKSAQSTPKGIKVSMLRVRYFIRRDFIFATV